MNAEEEVKGAAEISAQDEHAFDDVKLDIQSLVAAVSQIIDNHPLLREKNFGLYYQHGRLGYMDLDIMADRLKLAEEQKNVDKEKE